MAGAWFKYRSGPELAEAQRATKETCAVINALYVKQPEQATMMLTELLDECGPYLDFRPPFSIEYQERVRLGSNVVIYPGVTIGAGAIVSAGAVVTRDVAPGVVVGGNPAKVIRAL